MKVLFIAKNIPTPNFKGNAIILTIAKKISSFSKVSFLFPKEIVPFGFHFFKKYKNVYRLKKWERDGFNISIAKFPRLPLKNCTYLFWNKLSKGDIKYYIENGPFDIIHAHYLMPDGYLAYLYFKKFKIPYVVTIRNADIRILERKKLSSSNFKKATIIINNASQVITTNSGYKDLVNELFGNKTIVIPHGIEESDFSNEDVDQSKEILITCVSSFDEKKNVDWVIDAVKGYTGKSIIKLKIVGSGILDKKLRSQAGNSDRISFLGNLKREEVLNILRSSQIFALPSSEESFGLVYLEATASGNAIIGFENEGVWGVFEKDKEALFCTDKLSFNKQLYRLIDDDLLRKNLIFNSIIKANKYKWPFIVEEYERVYKNAISQFNKNKEII